MKTATACTFRQEASPIPIHLALLKNSMMGSGPDINRQEGIQVHRYITGIAKSSSDFRNLQHRQSTE